MIGRRVDIVVIHPPDAGHDDHQSGEQEGQHPRRRAAEKIHPGVDVAVGQRAVLGVGAGVGGRVLIGGSWLVVAADIVPVVLGGRAVAVAMPWLGSAVVIGG
jgi:hypothetical protein